MKVAIPQIKVGERHRKEMGDLDGLAKSIKELGLLQPIGVTEDMTLIFGERRLRACQDILGLDDIEARVIDMPSIVIGENAENEVRKDFTPSERVAIAAAIKEEFTNRRGGDTTEEGQSKRQNFATSSDDAPDLGQRTADFAAKKAGFGNRETLRQAEHVVAKAEPEIVEAMDKGVVSISSAYRAAQKPPEVQREIAKTGKTARDLERDLEKLHRDRAVSEPPAVKVITILNAVGDIANAGMSADEFRKIAFPAQIQRLHRSAIAAYAFLKSFVEVENDQKRAG